MTDALNTEIRSTLAVMVAEAPDPPSFDDLARHTAPPTPRRTRLSPAKAFSAGFAAAIIAVGVFALVIGPFNVTLQVTGTDPEVTVRTTTQVEVLEEGSLVAPAKLVAEDGAPTTLGETVLVPGTWSRVAHDESVFGGGDIGSVTVGGPGLVAVGNAVWTSVDGITWSRVSYDEGVFGALMMSSVTAGGPGLVAVGGEGGILDDVADVDAVADMDAAVLISVDGITWSRVPHDEEVFGGSEMNSVTVGGPGLIAVGQTEGRWTDTDAVVWTSVDGITWSRVPHDEKIFGGPGKQTMYDVVVGGPGLVAVGRDGDERPWDNSFASAAAVWTSPDGVTWSRVPHDETVFGTGGNPLMLSVTSGGPGLVAVGAQSHQGPFETPVWTSPDGFTWTRVLDDETVRGFMTAVTSGGPGLVAVGLEASAATAVWTSVNGITWSQVPNDDTVFGSQPDWISDVTVGGPGLVAVGAHSDNAAVWVWEE